MADKVTKPTEILTASDGTKLVRTGETRQVKPREWFWSPSLSRPMMWPEYVDSNENPVREILRPATEQEIAAAEVSAAIGRTRGHGANASVESWAAAEETAPEPRTMTCEDVKCHVCYPAASGVPPEPAPRDGWSEFAINVLDSVLPDGAAPAPSEDPAPQSAEIDRIAEALYVADEVNWQRNGKLRETWQHLTANFPEAAERWREKVKIVMREIGAAAPASSPVREAGPDNYVAWCRYVHNNAGETNGIRLCNSDSPGAFKVYRQAAASPDPEGLAGRIAEKVVRTVQLATTIRLDVEGIKGEVLAVLAGKDRQ